MPPAWAGTGSRMPIEQAVTTLADVDPADWNRLARQASVYSSYRWLRYVETHRNAVARYFLVRRGRELLAALPSYLFRADIPTFYDPTRLLGATRMAEPDRPVLIGGTREGYRSELLTSDALSEDERRTVVSLLLADLRRQGAEADALTAILYVPDHTVEFLAPCLRETDRLFVLDAEAVIAVPVDGLPAYLDRMPRHRRNTIRREMKRFAASDCRLEIHRLADCLADIGRLSVQLLGKYGRIADPDEEAHRFERQAAFTNELSRVFCAYRGDSMVGFAHFIQWRDTVYARSLGFDHDVSRQAALYFNLAYYSAIRYAAATNIRLINLGCDSFEAKVARGARLYPLWGILLDVDRAGLDHVDFTAFQRERLLQLSGLAGGGGPQVRLTASDGGGGV